MKKIIKSLLIITIIFSPVISKIYADEIPAPILGCTNNTATNYNPNATTDDGSCISPAPVPTTPIITWANPSDTIEGTTLNATQLNAIASVPGTYVYDPAIDTVLSTGIKTLSVIFTPTDTINYTTATANAMINVNPAPTGGSSNTALNINATVDVPSNCTVAAMDDSTHNYPETTSYLAICALEAASKNGSIYNVKLSNEYPNLGLFITGINGVNAGSNNYWALYQNGNYAMSGITLMKVATGDTITFQLQGFDDMNLNSSYDHITLNIHSLISNPTSGGGTFLAIPKTKSVFDTNKAFDFLTLQQKVDGSFGEDLYTDWTAFAFASSDKTDQKNKFIKYITEEKFSGNNLTDYERHAMALMALGINPYDLNGINYIKKITESFDGKQFGDANKDNDEIFALIVLQNAGYTQNDKMVASDISFILSKQNSDGSWDNSVDLTGASIEALSGFNSNVEVKNALIKAKDYLKKNQKTDGGFGNVSSTSWAMQGILALGEKPIDWINSENTPMDYLASNQGTDGGTKDTNTQNRIWQTSYVLASLSGKTWNTIMQKFTIPTIEIKNTKIIPPAITAKVTIVKTVKIPTKITHKNTKNLAVENTAAAINAVTEQTPTKQNWFKRFVSKIFGF